jgi:hypothetical protein
VNGQPPTQCTVADILIAISERRSWLTRFDRGDDTARSGIIDEVIRELGCDPSTLSQADRNAIIAQDYTAIQDAVTRSGGGGIAFIHVC